MARRERALTKDTTQTAGTGTYTLDNATAAGYQTVAQAVARGLAANGDEVIYRVSDAADPVLYEVGRGVIGSAGLTVTRAAILERDDGTLSPKSWPSGGARNFVVTFWPAELLKGANNLSDVASANTAADNIGAARKNASNTFTGDQTIARAATFATLKLDSDRSGVGQAVGNLDYVGHDSGGADTIYARVIGNILDPTDGSEDGELEFRCVTGGSVNTKVFSASGAGGVKDASGNRFVAFPTGGTVKMLFSSAPPTGWTRVNETNQAIIRLATAADTPNASGGSDSFFDGVWSTAGHTLAESQIPAHTHPVTVASGTGGSSVGLKSDGSSLNPASATGSTGGGGSHSHNMTTPYYRIACWATYD